MLGPPVRFGTSCSLRLQVRREIVVPTYDMHMVHAWFAVVSRPE